MPVTEKLITILEDYIEEKTVSRKIDEEKYVKRLRRLRKTDDEIHDIMIEFEDDCDREMLAGVGVLKAKRKLILSIVVAIAFMALTIFSVMGHLINRVSYIFYGAIAVSILTASKSYMEIKAVEHRKKRRKIKWRE